MDTKGSKGNVLATRPHDHLSQGMLCEQKKENTEATHRDQTPKDDEVGPDMSSGSNVHIDIIGFGFRV